MSTTRCSASTTRGSGRATSRTSATTSSSSPRARLQAEKRLSSIDEVDKADLEFPNDLLHELDRMRFVIPETGDEVVASERPVVIITSNNEKEPWTRSLRRCVFHFIDFPDVELRRSASCACTTEGRRRPRRPGRRRLLRASRAVPRLRKRPSTSELVDWITVLMQSPSARERLVRELPFLGVLLKKEQDVELLRTLRTAGGPRSR